MCKVEAFSSESVINQEWLGITDYIPHCTKFPSQSSKARKRLKRYRYVNGIKLYKFSDDIIVQRKMQNWANNRKMQYEYCHVSADVVCYVPGKEIWYLVSETSLGS